MKIGELSRRTGTSIRMLRYYEDQGLLDPLRRTNGYRDYSSEDVETVKRILTLNEAGITLVEIQKFLPCALAGRGEFESCDELLHLLRQQIGRVNARRSKLDESVVLLTSLLETMDTRPKEITAAD